MCSKAQQSPEVGLPKNKDLSQSPGQLKLRQKMKVSYLQFGTRMDVHIDERTGQQYYYNTMSKISQWEKPPCLCNTKEKE